MNDSHKTNSLVWGILLIVIGALLFAGQLVSWFNWGQAWPAFIIGAGALFFIAMLLGGKPAAGLAIPGSIVTTVGVILLAQNMFNAWETWAYAWGLIIAAVGFGVTIQGLRTERPDTRRQGLETLRVGLTLFLVFGILMEFIFSITGVSGRNVSVIWPVLLMSLGVFQIIVRIVGMIRHPANAQHTGFFVPILLAGIGGLATLVVWEVISGAQVLALINLWPLLLIAAGLQIIAGRQRVWVGALLGVLVVGVLVGMAFYGPQLGLANFSGSFSMNFPGTVLAHEIITGSGDLAEETRPVTGFNQVRLEGIGKLTIVPGKSESLVIRADANLLPYITTNVRGNELVIGVKRGYNLLPREEIEYTLTLTTLSAVHLDGAGDIEVGTLNAGNLKVSVSGAGGITLNGLEVKNFDVTMNGSGWVTATGQVDTVDIEINGAGNVDAAGLECNQAEVNINGLGKVTLWVTESLSAKISGAGSISYYGNPSVKKRVDGVGSIQPLGEK